MSADILQFTRRIAGLVLAPNNLTVRETCGNCGCSHKDAGTPFWIFFKGRTICDSCVRLYAPLHYRVANEVSDLWWLTENKRARGIVKAALIKAYKRPGDALGPLQEIVNKPEVRAMIEEARRKDAAQQKDAAQHFEKMPF